MSRSLAFIILAGLAGCSPSIMGYNPNGGACNGDCNNNDTDDTDDNRPDDDTDDDGSGNGDDDGGWVVDQDGDRIEHLDDCSDLTVTKLRSYFDEESAIGYRFGIKSGTFWPHGQLGDDVDTEIPSDFNDWDRQGSFYTSSNVCGVVIQWNDCGPFVRSSTTGLRSSHDLDDEPFHGRAVELGAWWPATSGGNDASAEINVTVAAKVCGEQAEVVPDYWCWGGPNGGCGTGLIALDPDLDEDYETELYRGY